MDDTQIGMIRAIHGGLPLSKQPFRDAAEKAGVSEDELLRQLSTWKEDGVIRRFGAIVRHHDAGYSANAMAVWDVSADRIEEFARAASSVRAISHCYQRPRFEGFPYNVYTMIHGGSRADCESAANEISARTGITEYELLFTTEEFKKSPPVYLAEESE